MVLDFGESETIHAHAKLNLALRIVGRRRVDQFHLLEMVNVELSLADTIVVTRLPKLGRGITISVTGDSEVRTQKAVIEDPRTSSLGRAFDKFCEAFSVRTHLAVSITKRIPTGAGLGGGTADAAALLRWCWDQLLTSNQRELEGSRELLLRIGAQVGADVPYSLCGGCALVTGIGEEITPLPWALSGVPVILVVPPVSVATPAAFAAYREAQRCFSEQRATTLVASGTTPSLPAELITNDLESIVSAHWPTVAGALSALRAPSLEGSADLVVGMTGSGSTLFCVPPSWNRTKEAADALEQLVRSRAPEGCAIIACRIR